MFSATITLLDLIYILVGYLVLRTLYCSFHNFKFKKYSKNLIDEIIKRNLHLHLEFWEKYSELKFSLYWLNDVKGSNLFNTAWHAIDGPDTNQYNKPITIAFNWIKKKSKWDFIFLYHSQYSQRGEYKLNKVEIRDKNIERLLISSE